MKTIDTSFDLNLLRVLLALASTRSVTAAAHALDMSQSGFSTALSRLRRRLEDPLFVRTEGGMSPTPRAKTMIAAAQEAMSVVAEGILSKPEFNPASAQTVFRFAIADAAEMVFLPRLAKHLQVMTPLAKLKSASYEPDSLRHAMTNAEVDLALGYFPDLDSQDYFQQSLYDHSFVCMVRKGHPVLKKGLTERSYAEYRHVSVVSPARSIILLERTLARRNIRRTVFLQTAHHLALPAVVEATDLIATLPLATAFWFAQSGNLELLRVPFPPIRFAVKQHWHPLVHQDPRSRWLRKQIAHLFAAEAANWKDVELALYGTIKKGKPPA